MDAKSQVVEVNKPEAFLGNFSEDTALLSPSAMLLMGDQAIDNIE